MRALALATVLMILCFAFSGCGENVCTNSDFTTTQGICVFNYAKADEDHVNTAIDLLENEVTKKFGHTIEQMENKYSITSISIIPGNTKKGLTRYRNDPIRESFEITISFYGCGAYKVIGHEVLHVIYSTINGVSDQNIHPVNWFVSGFYSDYENSNSVEAEMNRQVYRSICSISKET